MSYQTGGSIFGRTQQGVPNPYVPHKHPWPTRYHGPIFVQPQTTGGTYRGQQYTRVPFVGMGSADGLGCACGSPVAVGNVGPDGLGKLIAFGQYEGAFPWALAGLVLVAGVALIAFSSPSEWRTRS